MDDGEALTGRMSEREIIEIRVRAKLRDEFDERYAHRKHTHSEVDKIMADLQRDLTIAQRDVAILQKIVYGAVGLVLTSVAVAILAIVVRGMGGGI